MVLNGCYIKHSAQTLSYTHTVNCINLRISRLKTTHPQINLTKSEAVTVVHSDAISGSQSYPFNQWFDCHS